MNWLKKVLSWLTGSYKTPTNIPNQHSASMQSAPVLNDPTPVKGRKKRSGTTPKR